VAETQAGNAIDRHHEASGQVINEQGHSRLSFRGGPQADEESLERVSGRMVPGMAIPPYVNMVPTRLGDSSPRVAGLGMT